jgi:Uri superfamily endonuclease
LPFWFAALVIIGLARISDMNRKGGTYVLIILVEAPLCLQIGRLGLYDFPGGYYTYVGSAIGGLDGRLNRHLRSDKCYHWHIDYLLKSARIEEVWYTYSGQRLECIWNRTIARLTGATYPVHKFGASDCHCFSHLTHFAVQPILDKFIDILNESGCALKVSKCV